MEIKTPYLTTKELCDIFRVSPNTVTRWKMQGCPYFSFSPAACRGCRPRFELDKVKSWLEARTSEANKQNRIKEGARIVAKLAAKNGKGVNK